MAVERTIKAIGSDGESVIAELNVQDGGNAAEVIIPLDWRTVTELEDIALACTRMAEVLRQYAAGGGA